MMKSDGRIDDIVRQLDKEGSPVVLLESQSANHSASHTSLLAARPEAVIKGRGSSITVVAGGEERRFEADPWQALTEFYREHEGQLFGYLGYDMKNHTEDLCSGNPDPVGAPDFYFMVPGLLLKSDVASGRRELLKGELPEETPPSSLSGEVSVGEPYFSMSRESYMETIREAQRRIREGDFYEINLSHQVSAAFEGAPFELYRRMRRAGPVPFGAYLSLEGLAVCSQSPERFLKKDGRRLYSQPIKGTIRRGETPEEDRMLKKQLAGSAKERAENLMIVDLVRNDLGRVAGKGSVRVRDLFEIQSFETVHQMVSTVEAETDIENPFEILKACYPMGSMTGAPKISAMKSIEELENYRRGIYSGAIGYIGPTGNFDFNVVIRTAIVKGGQLRYSAGGAITGDSDPAAEWEETLVKCRALTLLIESGAEVRYIYGDEMKAKEDEL